MTKSIRINTDSIIQDLQERGLTLCYLNGKGIFILGDEDKLYCPDAPSHCFYIEHLMRRSTIVFNSTDYLPTKSELRRYTIAEIREKIQ